jgi:hypothetical protein
MRTQNEKVKLPASEPQAGSDLASPAAQPSGSSSRVQRIQKVAYHLAQERGFGPGAELDDWLAAERQVDEQLNSV